MEPLPDTDLRDIEIKYLWILIDERDVEVARLRVALKIARANLEAGTYTDASKDIIAAALR